MGTIAVIGGTGFLGRHIVSGLEESGYAVRTLSRRTGFDARNPDPGVFRGIDAVINLAGIKREQGEQTFRHVHVDLVRTLVATMKAAGVRRIIHVSVVVARPAENLPYHNTKWLGEQVIRESALDWTILRPGVIYGEGDDMLRHLSLMIQASPFFPVVGYGSAPMRPVHAADVAKVVLAALRTSCFSKTYDVVGPERLTLREVVARVADAMRMRVCICSTPVTLMRLPVWLMERYMEQPLSTRAQLTMLTEGLDGDPITAQKDLGLKATPFTVERIRQIISHLPDRKQ